jgi:hypothetical protein
VTVTSTAELKAALASLSQGSGGTILVDGSKGPYIIEADNLGLENAGVLITPLDADVQPHVYQVDIRGSSDITVHGMKIDSRAIDETRDSWDYDVNVLSSKSISIVNNDFQSDGVEMKTESNNAVDGERGIIARDSEDITITHNTMVDYSTGIVYLEVKGLDISHNDISGIQGDGLRGGGIQDVTITNNHIHDFHGTTQTLNHSDMIQIWGINTTLVTKNVEISNNVLDAGNGAATQSILIQNEGFPSNGLYFQDISIHNNIIHNGMAQGIGTRYVEGLEVYDNTVLWNEASTYLVRDGDEPGTSHPRLILRHSPDADVYGNIVSESIMNEVLIPSGDNYIIEYGDDGAENFVGNHIVNLSGQGDLSLQDLSIRPDSDLYGEFGAETSSDLFTPQALAWMEDDGSDAITTVMTQNDLPGRNTGVELSAKHTLVDGQQIDPNTAQVTWFFDDGQSVEGLEAIHVFDSPGVHEITLEIETAGGETATITRFFEALGNDVFDIDFDQGGIDITEFASLTEITDTEGDAFVQGRTGKAFDLDGNDRLALDRTNDQFSGLKLFQIDLGFKMEASAGNEGNLVQLHKAFTLNISDEGALTFDLDTSDGHFTATTGNGAVTPGQWADISVQYDGFEGKIDLVVDGEVLGTGAATGTTTATTGYDLILGTQWGTSIKGVVDQFTMTTPNSELETPLSASGTVEEVEEVDAMMDDITATPETALSVSATEEAPTPQAIETSAIEEPIAADEDDDNFIENLFDFLKDLLGISSDDAPTQALDLAPYAQHADQEAFAKPMALFEIVQNTGILPETAHTDGMEGEEDEDPDYNLAA